MCAKQLRLQSAFWDCARYSAESRNGKECVKHAEK